MDAAEMEWARSVVESMYADHPELYDRYGERGREKCLEDNLHHVRHLRTCYELQDARFFVDYARWLDGILRAHGMETEHLLDNFRRMLDTVASVSSLSAAERTWYTSCLHQACEMLRVRQEG
ncbi:hypothetical protein SAMN05421799_110111 [Alicyclobacillus vulcanalis]|uniref:Phycobilisome protein n=2 Tax=Alicyclobacillus vulcanalis TaxID=252246 RepID=A0A1N7NZW0_9BACL|nr:hypothetical protein [Alicyclobacillus vulcanalis]SIT03862.1 hypothetical protein SAMN05421799_110111 [Alicyclobacillus vulcanalis]